MQAGYVYIAHGKNEFVTDSNNCYSVAILSYKFIISYL